MSIKNQQIKRMTERVLTEELREGYYPEVTQIQRKINDYMKDVSVGLPSYQWKEVSSGEISNPHDYNEMLKTINEDLSISFSEVIDQTNRMVGEVRNYQSQKHLLELSLKRIENRLEALKEKALNNKYKYVFLDSFETFRHIDFDGDLKNNVPATTAFINLRNGQGMLDRVHQETKRYDLSSSAFEITHHLKDVEINEQESFQVVLKDTINELWQYQIAADSSDPVEIELSIDLQEILNASTLSLHLHSPKKTIVTLYVSEDNQMFKELETYDSYEQVEWQLSTNVRYLRFVLKKIQPDITIGTRYYYLFGATNMGLQKENYLSEGYITTVPYIIDGTSVQRIQLNARDKIPSGTHIRYYVGLQEQDQQVEWQEIKNHQSLDIKTIKTIEVDINEASDGYGKAKINMFQIPYHSIFHINDHLIKEKTKLYLGDYMWKVETQNKISETALLSDWKDVETVPTIFVPIEQTNNGSSYTLTTNSIQRLTTHIYCHEEKSLVNVPLITEAIDTKVYVNNSFLKPIADKTVLRHNYHFKKGWNKIQIIVATQTAADFQVNLYLKDIATKIYAIERPLKRVSPYDFYNNTSKHDMSCYAIDGNEVIVNYDPYMKASGDNSIRYQMEYSYFDEKEVNHYANVRLMAILKRSKENQQTTPILKDYQLIIT